MTVDIFNIMLKIKFLKIGFKGNIMTDFNFFSLETQISEIIFNEALKCYNNKNFEAALLNVNKAIALSPDQMLFYRLKAKIFLKKNELSLALRAINRAIKLKPYFCELYKLKNVVLLFSGKFKELFISLDELTRLNPESAIESNIIKAKIIGFALKKHDVALHEIEQVLIESPFHEDALKVKKELLELRFDTINNHLYI